MHECLCWNFEEAVKEIIIRDVSATTARCGGGKVHEDRFGGMLDSETTSSCCSSSVWLEVYDETHENMEGGQARCAVRLRP